MESVLRTAALPFLPGYTITSDGQVWSDVSKRWLALNLKQGYLTVTIKRKNYAVHRLMALVFFGPPQGKVNCALHRDGVKTNNQLHNLYWGTRADNYQDTVRHGTSPHGSRNGQSKLTQIEVDEIREGYASGLVTMSMLGELYGVSSPTVQDIIHYKLWPEDGTEESE